MISTHTAEWLTGRQRSPKRKQTMSLNCDTTRTNAWGFPSIRGPLQPPPSTFAGHVAVIPFIDRHFDLPITAFPSAIDPAFVPLGWAGSAPHSGDQQRLVTGIFDRFKCRPRPCAPHIRSDPSFRKSLLLNSFKPKTFLLKHLLFPLFRFFCRPLTPPAVKDGRLK